MWVFIYLFIYLQLAFRFNISASMDTCDVNDIYFYSLVTV